MQQDVTFHNKFQGQIIVHNGEGALIKLYMMSQF